MALAKAKKRSASRICATIRKQLYMYQNKIHSVERRIERISYEVYNERTMLVEAIDCYRDRTGHYPKRVLADQIYRTKECLL